MSFSENLRKLRKKENLSQLKLAQMLNLADTSISAYELNKNEPTIDTLKNMSKLFKISIDDLVSNDFERNISTETKEIRYLISNLSKDYTLQVFYVKSLLQYQNKK